MFRNRQSEYGCISFISGPIMNSSENLGGFFVRCFPTVISNWIRFSLSLIAHGTYCQTWWHSLVVGIGFIQAAFHDADLNTLTRFLIVLARRRIIKVSNYRKQILRIKHTCTYLTWCFLEFTISNWLPLYLWRGYSIDSTPCVTWAFLQCHLLAILMVVGIILQRI